MRRLTVSARAATPRILAQATKELLAQGTSTLHELLRRPASFQLALDDTAQLLAREISSRSTN